MRWFTSDLHFFHTLVYRKYRQDYVSMHDEMIKQWNKQVRGNDIVYIIGDVTFGKFEDSKEILQQLKGRKILIRGNHDERFTSKEWIELGFEDVRDNLTIKKNNEKWMLYHYPYTSALRFFLYFLRDKYIYRRGSANYYSQYLSYKGRKLIHGHHHDGPIYKFNQVNVAWDIHRRLLNENEIEEIFQKNKPTWYNSIIETIKSIFW